MTADVAIFVLDRAHFALYDYFVRWLVAEWEAAGLRILVTEDAAEALTARVVLSHLDLSAVPRHLTARLAGHPRVLNRSNTDIRKRRVSRHVVRRPGDHAGPVIVKTDLNYGGLPERQVRRERSVAHRALNRLRGLLPWSVSGLLPPGGYRIYPTAAAVPRPVWWNPALVVERFLPERIAGYYGLRHHFFFGDRHCDYLLLAKEPIVKSSRVVACEPVGETPTELHAIRRALALDYGRFDYVLADGRPVVFDANRTPAFTLLNRTFPHADVGRHLAGGIWDFFDGDLPADARAGACRRGSASG